MNNTKSILILNWRCPTNPQSGGAERVTLEHAKGWVKHGWKVTWIAGNYKMGKKYEVIDGIEIYRYGSPFSIYFLAAFIYWFTFKGNFDVVIDEIHGIPFFTPLWAWKSKKIVYIHEVAQEIWDEMFTFPFNVIGKLSEKIYFLFYRNTPFLTVSQSTKDDLITFGIPSKQITIIPNGLSIKPIQEPSIKESTPTLLFVSRLVKMKGIEDAIHILAIVKKTIPEIQLWIVGGGKQEYVDYLKSLTKSLQVEDNITFFGYVPEKEKIKLYQKAHVLVHTSVREGFGLVVIEANSQGTPAIVYNSPGLQDVVQHNLNGFKIEKGNKEEMAYTICNLLQDKDRYNNLIQTSLAYSQQFNWSERIQQSITLIEHIVAS
jgi:glycosyltransferase involved in cell wall biosynthesis